MKLRMASSGLALMALAGGARADDTAARIEITQGGAVHAFQTTALGAPYQSEAVLAGVLDVRAIVPGSWHGAGIRVGYAPGGYTTDDVFTFDAYYSFGYRPRRLDGLYPIFALNLGPTIAAIGASLRDFDGEAQYPGHATFGGMASLSLGFSDKRFVAAVDAGYRGGVPLCNCGIPWDGDFFASLDFGIAFDVRGSSRSLK